MRCTAREGMCKLTGADGELTQHFASLADGEAYLAEQENVSKGGFIAAAGNNASETSDDADTTVNYDETITDALQYHNDTLKQLEHVTKILENINQSRNFLNEYIVSPAGDLIAPQLFPTITDKIALLERSGKYFATANETERKLNAIANSVRAILGRNTSAPTQHQTSTRVDTDAPTVIHCNQTTHHQPHEGETNVQRMSARKQRR